MDALGLTKMLEAALDRLGVPVRVETMPDETRLAGGLCFVRGKPEVFVSPRAGYPERVDVLVGALRELDTESIWLPPAVRTLVDSSSRTEDMQGGSTRADRGERR